MPSVTAPVSGSRLGEVTWSVRASSGIRSTAGLLDDNAMLDNGPPLPAGRAMRPARSSFNCRQRR